MVTFSLRFSTKAKEDLAAIRDRKTQQMIVKAIKKLETLPQERGKALEHDFAGYRRLRAAQNYRVIYRVKEVQGYVVVCVIGLRKTVYDVTRRRW